MPQDKKLKVRKIPLTIDIGSPAAAAPILPVPNLFKAIIIPITNTMNSNGTQIDYGVSNVVFTNGAIEKCGDIDIYYASSDTRLHVAKTTVEKMVDYCKNTPKDGYTTHTSVDNICRLIDMNNR